MIRAARVNARLRLTLLYLGLFVGLGAVLLALNYQLVASDLPKVDSVVTVQLPTTPFPVEMTGAVITDAAIPVTSGTPGLPPAMSPADREAFQKALDASASESVKRSVADYRRQTLHDLVRKSGLALAITALIAAALGWLAAGRVLRPLHVITAAAQRLNDDTLHERINLAGPQDELRNLADTFDGMLDRLEASFAAERRLVANASHELRTPLAIQKTLLEVGLADPSATAAELREMGEKVLAQATRHEQLVNRMLLLSQATNVALDHAAVHVNDLVEQAVAATRRDDVAVTTTLDHRVVVKGDPFLIEALVTNLIGNAIVHNVPGGWVTVTIAESSGGHPELVVENSGPIIAPDQIARLLEPFRRGTRDRTGSAPGVGLGLALVSTVAERHGWQLSLDPRADGGVKAVVSFATVRERAVVDR